jgi:hypothetical protein
VVDLLKDNKEMKQIIIDLVKNGTNNTRRYLYILMFIIIIIMKVLLVTIAIGENIYKNIIIYFMKVNQIML